MISAWRKAQLHRVRKAKIKSQKQLEHEMHEAHCSALCCARSGQSARVLSFARECSEAARLREMGICEGATVTVLRDGDPLVVRVDDARFGIGREAAMRVLCDLID
ncbi:MAG TPA: FeoA family protein [Abditibacteriaceae bacterium]|jgi:Fe2+ transport system protein FeoA